MNKRNFIIYAIILLLAAAGTIAGLELSNTTHWFHSQPIATVALNNGKTAKANPNVPSSQNKPSSATGPTAPNSPKGTSNSTSQNQPIQIDPGVQPQQPIGQFVSDHNPSSTNENEVSTCTTTPGATCQIVFTSGSLTKTLTPQTTGGQGSTTWSWTPAQLGLTSGSWKITVTASNGSKTASIVDQKELIIS